jgi:hypothetical protein
MNRHSRITDRVKRKNDIMHFQPDTNRKTKMLCKEYVKLYELNIHKQLGKLKGDDAWAFIERISKFRADMQANPQTKGMQFTMSTYEGFDTITNTPLAQFAFYNHTPLF